MYTKQQILAIVEQKVLGTLNYIVDIEVKPTNKIRVFVENDNGISIQDCAEISRFIQANLDREIEDYDLEVSSPGLDAPFRTLKQYLKNLNKQVKVITKEGKVIEGKLISATEEKIAIEVKNKTSKKNINPKSEIQSIITIDINQIKETKIIIIF